ncbi:hypothetical protein F2Q69_00061470 [Brassica cretica]|uniref:F-box domain-containing protein n=1 Tax=Brassica cretica TaxID=69181 RepID=A0A8S9RCY3_BRACR|nr:hypothetical protein F2Q69_00061470 [Brassica cretica]
MDGLPRDLMHKILFMIDHRSVAMMRCTNRSLQTHINDPYFESEYSSRVGSGLVHISASGSSYLSYNPNGDSRSLKTKDTLKESHILGSCSGLLLVFVDDRLCVVNPVTKKFRYFNQSWFMRFTGVFSHTGVVNRGNKKHIVGYKPFPIVSELELKDETALGTRNEDMLSCYITGQARDVVVSLHVEVRITIEMSQALLVVTDCYGDLTSYGEAFYIIFQCYKPVQVMIKDDRNSLKEVKAHKKAVTRCLVQW